VRLILVDIAWIHDEISDKHDGTKRITPVRG